MRHPYRAYDWEQIVVMSNSHFLLRAEDTKVELKGQMVHMRAPLAQGGALRPDGVHKPWCGRRRWGNG